MGGLNPGSRGQCGRSPAGDDVALPSLGYRAQRQALEHPPKVVHASRAGGDGEIFKEISVAMESQRSLNLCVVYI